MRELEGLTLDSLANRTGLHRTSIGLIERGRRNVTVKTASQVAEAFGLRASDLVALGEGRLGRGRPGELPPRPSLDPYLKDAATLRDASELNSSWVADGVLSSYKTLDLIDSQLLARKMDPLAGIIELPNLSSMLGNLLCGGLVAASEGRYRRNSSHAYPDLLAEGSGLSGIEVKTAIETYLPKGHLAKPGFYMTFRYVLGDRCGGFQIGDENRGDTVWVWECRVGNLTKSDFALSSTEGDSGKTANIKTEALKSMRRVLYVPQFLPYKRRQGWYGDDPIFK